MYIYIYTHHFHVLHYSLASTTSSFSKLSSHFKKNSTNSRSIVIGISIIGVRIAISPHIHHDGDAVMCFGGAVHHILSRRCTITSTIFVSDLMMINTRSRTKTNIITIITIITITTIIIAATKQRKPTATSSWDRQDHIDYTPPRCFTDQRHLRGRLHRSPNLKDEHHSCRSKTIITNLLSLWTRILSSTVPTPHH